MMRDWFNDELEEENVAFLLPFVWDWMFFDYTHTGNFRVSWEIDPSYGIEQIAYSTAMALDQAEDGSFPEIVALKARLGKPAGEDESPEFIYLRDQGRGFINVVSQCIKRLVEMGRLDFTFEWGWPCIRITMDNLPSDTGWFPGVARDRAEKMRARFDDLRAMPYVDYLKSEEWRYRREIHLEAAGNRCQLCNSDQQPLHVHHRTYANRGRERFYDLVVLCPPCHEAFHKTGRKIR